MSHPVLFFGRFHPLLVHLPIGFLILLGIVELSGRLKWIKVGNELRAVLVFTTAGAALVTVICGLMLSTEGGYPGDLLRWHKWTGILLCLLTLAMAWGIWQRQLFLYTGALLGSLLMLTPASHFGGSLTHGRDYLLAYAPGWMKPRPPMMAAATTQVLKGPAQAQMYTDLVQPIFAQNCVACHGPEKTSAQLRLDSFAAILHGGKGGPAVIAGNSVVSPVIARIHLPASTEKHMPPDGKPQLTDDQIELLTWWIDSGAGDRTSVADTKPTDDQLALVSRLLKLPTPADAGEVPPIAMDDLTGPLQSVVAGTHVVITPVAVDQPWLIVNAAINRGFDDAALAQLAAIAPNVVDLDLAGTKISDSGLVTVSSMPNLHRLRLDRTAITDAGLLHLKGLNRLLYLNLYGTSVTDDGLKTLAALPSLRQLYLWRTKVTPAATAAFTAQKTDASKMDRLKKQIEKLQQQIDASKLSVIQAVTPTTAPVKQ